MPSSETKKLAAIGDSQSTKIFAALGIEVHVFDDRDEASLKSARTEARRIIESGEYGVLFITEELSTFMNDVLEEAQYYYLPSIILVPDIKGSRGLAQSVIRETLKKAAGRDIMAEEE